ncbi:hypothetical protein D3C85_977060 [compost metagenome]
MVPFNFAVFCSESIPYGRAFAILACCAFDLRGSCSHTPGKFRTKITCLNHCYPLIAISCKFNINKSLIVRLIVILTYFLPKQYILMALLQPQCLAPALAVCNYRYLNLLWVIVSLFSINRPSLHWFGTNIKTSDF